MNSVSVILASASPRRRELLSRLDVPFEVIPAQGEEHITADVPAQAVCALARQKAAEVAGRVAKVSAHRNRGRQAGAQAADQTVVCTAEESERDDRDGVLVIGADTIVVKDGRILGKPADEEDAFRMLSMLRDDVHEVYTGVCLILRQDLREQTVTFYEMTKVYFGPMSDAQIRAYIATGDPMDKAGAYGIQSGGGAYITHIEGDYDNVVGLPVRALENELRRLGVLTRQPGGQAATDGEPRALSRTEHQMQSVQRTPARPRTEQQCRTEHPDLADARMDLRIRTGQHCPRQMPQRTYAENAGVKRRLEELSAALGSRTPRPPVPRRENAVLLPLIETRDGYDLLFEMRALGLKHQPGDICLPGGRIEAGETPREAALRETEEELLIRKEQVRVLFAMDGLIGPGERTVWPFAAVLSGYQGTSSPQEVDHTFRIPLSWFLAHPPRVFRGRRTTVPQADFPYERIAGGRDYWKGGYEYDILVYENEGTAVWGITARVVDAFVRLYLGISGGAPV